MGINSDPNSARAAAAQGLAQVVSSVAACVYDKPSNFIDPTKGTLTLKPGAFSPILLPADSTCSDAAASTTANGWGIDQDMLHIRVCGAACTTIQTAITDNELINAQRNQSGPAYSNQTLIELDVP